MLEREQYVAGGLVIYPKNLGEKISEGKII